MALRARWHVSATADFTPDNVCGQYKTRVDGKAYGTPEQTFARAMAFLPSYRNDYDTNRARHPYRGLPAPVSSNPTSTMGSGNAATQAPHVTLTVA